MTPDVLIMSMKAWRSLDPADQNIFRDAARDTSIFFAARSRPGAYASATAAQRRVILFFWPIRASSANDVQTTGASSVLGCAQPI